MMATAKNTLQQLHDHGQSPWLDYITRDILRNGKLQEMIELGIMGMTSNPTIFQKAIGGSQLYEDELRRWDWSAGVLVVLAAGGVVSRIGKGLVAAGAAIHHDLSELIAG